MKTPKIEHIYQTQIQPQQLGTLKERLSQHKKFVDWYNLGYETNEHTIMPNPSQIQCLHCKNSNEIPTHSC